MSHIGKKPIEIPQGVEVKIDKGRVTIKGPKGELYHDIPKEISVEEKEGKLIVAPGVENKRGKSFWGLTRTLLANNIKGVTEGFEKKLEIRGIGYKAALQGKELQLDVGFSHQVKMKIPENIEVLVEKNVITVSGINKQEVGELAAKIRKIKPPEPYKGKGIRYLGEKVRRKEGKKAVSEE